MVIQLMNSKIAILKRKQSRRQKDLSATFSIEIFPATQQLEIELEVAEQRPKGVTKSGRLVFFNEKMANPRKTVGRNGSEKNSPTPLKKNGHQHTNEEQTRSDKMEQSGAFFAVFSEVVRIKLPKALDTLSRHAVNIRKLALFSDGSAFLI